MNFSNENMKLLAMKAEVFAALGHPIRLAAAEYLSQGERCVCDIAEQVGSERSNVSRHLAVMVKAGVLQSRKEGLRVIYRLKTPCLTDFLSCVTEVIRQQLSENTKALRQL